MSVRRESILREMGLAPLWRLRGGGGSGEAEPAAMPPGLDAEPPAQQPPQGEGASAPMAVRPATAPRASVADPEPASPGERREPPAAVTANDGGDPARAARIALMDWDALEADIRGCTACELCRRRKQAVPGVGDRRADWMLVGEGPGAEEDQRGEPFVGAAGRLLDAMLASIGLRRGEGVYIANAVKCRPPHNRTPESAEIAACLPYLERQIELVRPRILLALGRPAAQALLKAEVSIAASRGRVFHYGEVPVVVTYHPAYLLRNQADKAKAWEDLCFARRQIA